MLTVTKQCDFTDWLFLKYLSKNLDGLIVCELFLGLAEDLEEKKPLLPDSDEESTLERPKKRIWLIFNVFIHEYFARNFVSSLIVYWFINKFLVNDFFLYTQ